MKHSIRIVALFCALVLLLSGCAINTSQIDQIIEESTTSAASIEDNDSTAVAPQEDSNSVEYDDTKEAIITDETLDLADQTKDDLEENADLSTNEIVEEEVDESLISDEGALEEDGVVEIENIAWEGTNTGNGLSLLGSWQGITYYSQADSRWASIPYTSINKSSQTIKSSGCGPTSAAMVVSSSIGAITPPTMAKLYVDNGYRTANNGTAWAAFSFTADYFDFNEFYTTTSYSKVYNYLKTDKNNDGVSDYFVIASCGPGLWTTGGHYIALMGDSDGTLRVHDPYYYAGKYTTTSRKAANVSMSGNIAYITEVKFTGYSNAKNFWVFSNDHQISSTGGNSGGSGSTGTQVNYTRYIATESAALNVRSGPGTNYSVVGQLGKGTKVTVYEVTGGWSRIGTNRWVSSAYLSATAVNTTSTSYTAYTTASTLNIRKGPGTNYKTVGSLKKGSKVTVYETKNGWARIGDNKWVSTSYLTTKTTTTTKITYKTTVGKYYRLTSAATLYSKGNLTGIKNQYKAATKVKVLKHYNSNVDYIQVVNTGRKAYIQVSKLKGA
jgi:uncharacterized protein YgiM (DUF1202 family)